jgi:hypothetical protein
MLKYETTRFIFYFYTVMPLYPLIQYLRFQLSAVHCNPKKKLEN